MDLAQILNGSAATLAFLSSIWTFLRFHDSRYWPAVVAHMTNGTLLLWYAIINLLVGTGIWDADNRQLVPLFRWAFAPLLLSYALRQAFAGKRKTQGRL